MKALETPVESAAFPLVFLVDVDDTLIENDRIQDDLQDHLGRKYGAECRDRYCRFRNS